MNYNGSVIPELLSIYQNPNKCPLQSEMTEYPENCHYFTQTSDPLVEITPKYPCFRCMNGFSGEITPLTIQQTFLSHHLVNCLTEIEDCDTSFDKILGADIRYDKHILKETNFLTSKFFSCIKCINGKIPVATLYRDSNNKTFYYKQYDALTFSQINVNTNGQSVVCRDPSLSEQFGLTTADPNFDLDPNCAMAIIDLSREISSSTKTQSRYRSIISILNNQLNCMRCMQTWILSQINNQRNLLTIHNN